MAEVAVIFFFLAVTVLIRKVLLELDIYTMSRSICD